MKKNHIYVLAFIATIFFFSCSNSKSKFVGVWTVTNANSFSIRSNIPDGSSVEEKEYSALRYAIIGTDYELNENGSYVMTTHIDSVLSTTLKTGPDGFVIKKTYNDTVVNGTWEFSEKTIVLKDASGKIIETWTPENGKQSFTELSDYAVFKRFTVFSNCKYAPDMELGLELKKK